LDARFKALKIVIYARHESAIDKTCKPGDIEQT